MYQLLHNVIREIPEYSVVLNLRQLRQQPMTASASSSHLDMMPLPSCLTGSGEKEKGDII